MSYQFTPAGEDPRYQPPAPTQGFWAPPSDGHGFAVTALVCGIIGVVVGLIPIMFVFALALGVCGIIFGFTARAKHRRLRYVDLTVPVDHFYRKGDKVTIGMEGNRQVTGKVIEMPSPGNLKVDKGRPKAALWGMWLGALAIVLGVVGFAIVNSALNDLSNNLNDIPTEETVP